MERLINKDFQEAAKRVFNISPLMGPVFSIDDFYSLDLSIKNKNLPDVSTPASMTLYLKGMNKLRKRTLAYGGYLEKRNIYQSSLFKEKGPIRNIHLAVDVWTEKGTPIYAPIDGIVHSLTYNGNDLDYGYTLILHHLKEEFNFYTLYGHLSKSIIEMFEEGMSVDSGQLIGHLGEEHENGGWSPHVHFQVIFDLEGKVGDYPGVCSQKDIDHYKNNCPDPTVFILPKNSK